MATNLKDKTILCIDNGLFMEFCLKLADSFKKVYYYVEWKDAYPGMAKAVIGTEWLNGKRLDTFDGKPFERIDNLYDYLDKVDMVFFPDIYDGDLAQFLLEKGMPIAGSMKGEELELERWDTKQYFKKIGMDVQPIQRVIGIDNLHKALEKTENKWVKISKFRKQFETFHHIRYDLSRPLLDKIQMDMGPMGKIAEFIIEDNIEADVEEGIDAYTVDGKFPNYVFAGCEIKDLSFAGKFYRYTDLSEGIKEVNKQVAPLLKNYGYRGFFSSEVRTTKDGKHYFIDPCCRLGSPPNELYQEMYTNLADIVWNLGQGNVIDPIPAAKYGMEVLIHSDWALNGHQAIHFPPELRKYVKLRNILKVDNQYYTLNLHNLPEAGAIVTTGSSLEECKKKLEEIAPKVEGYGLNVRTDSLDKAIEEFTKMENKKS